MKPSIIIIPKRVEGGDSDMMSTWRSFVVLLLGLIICLNPSFSNAKGTLEGFIQDQGGVGISDALVSTGDGYTAFSQSDGSYSMQLAAGTYQVTASSTCYTELVKNNVVIVDNVPTTLDFTLHELLCLEGVYPSLGELKKDLPATVYGKGFDGGQTRLTLVPDSGNRMHIFGTVDTPGTASSVVVKGEYAYVGDVDSLQVISITDPTKMVITGTVFTPDWARGVDVHETTAYVADGESGLQVVDISDPQNPEIIGSVNTPGYAWSVKVNEESGEITAYVGDYDGGLQVIDVSNPGNPVIKGSTSTPYPALGVAVKDGMAYVACGVNVNGGLQIIDVNNPANPVKKGFVMSAGYARDVAVKDNIAYLTDYTGGLKVIDVTDPLSPIVKGSIDTPSYAEGLTVIGDLVYVADYHTGLVVINASNPSEPFIQGIVDSPGDVLDVFVKEDIAYVADEIGLKQIDISDPEVAAVIGNVMTDKEAYSAVYDGTYAYVTDVHGLEIINVNDPNSLSILSSVETQGSAYDVAVANGRAFIADGDKGLQIIDISNPNSPVPGQLVTIPGVANVVSVSGGRAYVGNWAEGFLHIIDVSEIGNATNLGMLDPPGIINDIFMVGTTAYLATSLGGLRIYDLSNPLSPDLLGSYMSSNEITGVVVNGSTAYITTKKSSLEIINVDIPSSIVELGAVDTPGYAWNLFVDGNVVYVASGNSGVHAIDVNDPTNPFVIGTSLTPGYARSLAVDSGLAYVADWHAGFSTVPVPVELSITVSDKNTISVNIPSPPMAGHYNLRTFDSTQEYILAGAVTFTEELSLLTSKAIIVAGGGPDDSLGIWEETKAYANYAYENLLYQGYQHDNIYYITAEDTIYRDSDALSATNLQDAIAWAKNDPETSDLLVYLTDHGETDRFLMKGGQSPEYVSAEQIDTWLDDFQSITGGKVIVVYDACKAGSFIQKLLPPAEKIRVTITSSNPQEVAYYLTRNHSFSSHFWSTFSGKSGYKANMLEAFEHASSTMSYYQTAQVDANGNGVANEPEDLSVLNGLEGSIYALRRQYKLKDRSKPVVAKVSQDQVLIGATSAKLSASNIYDVDGDKVVRVWAEVVAPYFNPDEVGLTVTNLPNVELIDPDGDGVYEGESSVNGVHFNVSGTYIITYYAEDAEGFHSLPKTSLVTQTIADIYELDDIYQDAKIINPNDPFPQNHSFHKSGDEDWVKFFGIAGETYKIKASNPSIICDPIIELYDVDGQSLLYHVNEAGSATEEFINWTCPADGVYFVRLQNNTNHFGVNVDYELKVFNPIAFSLPGYVSGTVTSNGKGIGGVILRAGGGSAISQTNGSYIMSLKSGSHSVSVSKTGYKSTSFGVSIPSGGSTKKNVSLTATQNLAPSISGSPQVIANTFELYSFTPAASDPENNLLIFSVQGLPSWAGFNATDGTISGIPNGGDVGSYGPIILTVSDSKSTSSMAPFSINVITGENFPPVISGGSSLIIPSDKLYSFTPNTSDPNGDLLQFSISGKPDWAQFDVNTGRLYGVPGDENIGAHGPLTISVTDPYGAGAFLSPFTLEVVSGSEFNRLRSLQGVYLLLTTN